MSRSVIFLFRILLISYFYDIQSLIQKSSNNRSHKLILFWTTFYGHEYFEFGSGHRAFTHNQCEIDSCETTSDRSRLAEADAVIFHMRNIQGMRDLPTSRSANQIFVFYLLEHPENQWNDLRQFAGYFNATMTYRRDSTIAIPYGAAAPTNRDRGTPQRPSDRVGSNVPTCRTKAKSVAWFVSNCNSPGGRHLYYDKLKKYIDIDVYGNCGTLRCPENMAFHTARMNERCYTMLSDNYKFYLSFESHHCADYVTEKFWNILQLADSVIPVVLGAVDYSEFAPLHSYIDASLYTPQRLAALLGRLAANETQFREYFRWKDEGYRISGQVEMANRGFCELCALLHEKNPPFAQIHDLHEWWTLNDTVCDRQRFPDLAVKT